MIRFLLRFIGLLLLALAFIFVIYDGMRSIADRALVWTKVGQLWNDLHASSLQALQATVERTTGVGVWRFLGLILFDQPVALVFGLIGAGFILLGRKKKPLIGYARD